MADLKRITHIIADTNAAYHDIWARMGLSDSVADILYTLSLQEGSVPLTEIISLTGIPKQTLNSALRKLEKEGITQLHSSGGRKKLVCLTEQGKTLAQSTVCRVMAAENNIFNGWTEAELAAFMELNQRYLNQLREKIKEF